MYSVSKKGDVIPVPEDVVLYQEPPIYDEHPSDEGEYFPLTWNHGYKLFMKNVGILELESPPEREQRINVAKDLDVDILSRKINFFDSFFFFFFLNGIVLDSALLLINFSCSSHGNLFFEMFKITTFFMYST